MNCLFAVLCTHTAVQHERGPRKPKFLKELPSKPSNHNLGSLGPNIHLINSSASTALNNHLDTFGSMPVSDSRISPVQSSVMLNCNIVENDDSNFVRSVTNGVTNGCLAVDGLHGRPIAELKSNYFFTQFPGVVNNSKNSTMLDSDFANSINFKIDHLVSNTNGIGANLFGINPQPKLTNNANKCNKNNNNHKSNLNCKQCSSST